MVPAALRATSFGKWELTACNATSVLSGDLPPSWNSTQPTPRGLQPQGTTTCYMVTTGLRLFYLLGILPTIPIVSLILFLMPVVTLFTLSTLFAEPKVDTALAKKH